MPLRPLRPRQIFQQIPDTVCLRCFLKLSRFATKDSRPYSTSVEAEHYTSAQQNILKRKYFLDNDNWSNGWLSREHVIHRSTRAPGLHASESISISAETPPALPLAEAVEPESHGTSTPGNATAAFSHLRKRRKAVDNGMGSDDAIPLDTSARLSALCSTMPDNSLLQRFFTYLALSKPRLTFLIVLTTAASYSLFPVAVSPLSATLSLSPLTFLNLTAGTALSSAAANALNMLLEPDHDAKMSRTRTRPLVRGLLSKRAALVFAIVTGTAGVGLLYWGVNPTVAFLSGLNIFLYAGVYTPLKRVSVVNTWIGALVGGIPPLMGWAAAAYQSAPSGGWRELLFDPATSTGGWLLAGLLFAWQFPHFNALSHIIRHEYAYAGYRMLASINPRQNALVGLRYSLAMVPVCVGLTYVGVTGWMFVPASTVVNAWMVKEAWSFWRANSDDTAVRKPMVDSSVVKSLSELSKDGANKSARRLFWASVWHLPLILVLAMVCKTGLWDRLIRGGLDDAELEEYSQGAYDVESRNALTPSTIRS